MTWAKLHTEILGDLKLMRASRRGAQCLFVLPWLIAVAKEADEQGRLTSNGEPVEPDDLAMVIPCVTPAQIAKGLEELTTLGVLVRDPDGALRFANWETRQAKPSDAKDAASERKRRQRERDRAAKAAGSNGHADAVTRDGHAPDVTRSRGVTGVTVSRGEVEVEGEGETEGETETSTAKEGAAPDGASRSPALALVKPAKAEQQPGKAVSIRRLNADGVVTVLHQVMADVAAGAERRLAAEEHRRLLAGMVFAYWAKKMAHPNALLDDARERVLIKRLKENGENVDELLYVVDGALKDDWVMGRADRSSKKYDGIEHLFKNRAKVEELASNCDGYRQQQRHPITEKYLRVVNGRKRDAQ